LRSTAGVRCHLKSEMKQRQWPGLKHDSPFSDGKVNTSATLSSFFSSRKAFSQTAFQLNEAPFLVKACIGEPVVEKLGTKRQKYWHKPLEA
jgi:hypothetical protein